MFRKKKIKTQIVISTAIILGIISLLQIFLYSILQKENKNTVSSIFDSIAHTSAQQIEKLNEEITKTSSLLSVHRTVQANLYEYSSSEIVRISFSAAISKIAFTNSSSSLRTPPSP